MKIYLFTVSKVVNLLLIYFSMHCEFRGSDAFAFHKDVSMNWPRINDRQRSEFNFCTAGKSLALSPGQSQATLLLLDDGRFPNLVCDARPKRLLANSNVYQQF